jgi:uncharacterized protein YukE
MDTKNALYAAVGAPIAAAKTLTARFESFRTELESRTEDLAQTAQKMLDEWAKAVTKVSDGKMVDEFASKVDFDQAREQVNKLRDQLEDMLTTWRASFRPVEEAADKAVDKVDEMTTHAPKKPATKPAAKTTAAKKPAAKKPATKKPAANSTTTKKPAAPKAS